MPHPKKLKAGWVESWEKLLAQNLPFKIFLKGRDLTYLACNENYAMDHGLKASEILGRSDYDLYPRELAEKYRVEDLRILETGRSETIEGRYVKDGQEHHGQTIKSLFRDQSDEVIGILGTFWDVTELVRVKEALQESEIRYRELFENINSGVAVYTVINDGQDFIFKDFNRAGERIDHDQRERLIGKSIFEVRPGVEQFGLLEVFRQVWRTGEPAVHPVTSYQDNKLSGWYENFVYKLPSGEIVAVFENITERKQAEEKVQTLARFPSENPNPVLRLGREGTILYANSASRLLLQDWGCAVGEPAPLFWQQEVTEALASQTNKAIDVAYGDITFSFFITPIVEADYVNVYGRDITARKRTEEKLQESEERYRSLFDTMAQGVVYQNTAGRIIHANPAAEKILGLSLDQMRGRTSVDPRWRAIHEDGSDFPGETHPAIVALRTGREVRDVVMGVFNPSKEAYSWIMINAVPQFHPGQGKPHRVYTTFDDITTRKNAEDALRESEERYRSLFEHMVDGYAYCKMLYDDQGHPVDFLYLDVNQAFKRLAGLENVEGKPVSDAIPGIREPHPDLFQSYGRVASTSKPEKFEIDFQPSNKWFSISVYSPAREYFVAVFEDITERRQAEEALRESKERLELALIGGDLGFYDWDLQTGGGYTDERYLSMLGYAPGEIDLSSRANWERQVHPEDLSFANFPVQSDLWGETLTYDEEYRMRHKSGEWVWVRDRSQITARAADGRPLRVTGTHENINERKRVEEALYFSNQRLELAQRSAGAGIWDWDMTRRHLDWSRELYLLFGLDPDQVEATFDIWHQVLHPDDREAASHRIDQAIEDKIPLISEYRVIHPDGRVRWIRALGNTIYDPSGQPLRMTGICIDITNRKRAEEALQKSETLLEEVSEMAKVGGWELDVETKQVYWTSETYRIHEIPEGEEIDLSKALLFLDLPQRSTLETALQHCIETGEGFNLELPFTSAKGRHLWTRVLGRAVKADDKVIRLTGTFQDITERRELEERIRQVRSDLLFAVSHDLKTPLQVLHQSQEMLSALKPGEALEQFQEYSEIWRRNLQRLERMINNLVDSQRGEEDRFPILLAPCRLEEIVQRVVEDLTGYALALQVQFDLQLEPVPEGSCDEEAIARVVENLLTNAVKFSPKGGRVEIRLGMEGDNLLLEVEDHGLGIPANEQEQLFQPFQRGSAQRKGVPGTGLGLYVCRRIMEAHGGTISLQSTEGVGTTVTVTLPLRE